MSIKFVEVYDGGNEELRAEINILNKKMVFNQKELIKLSTEVNKAKYKMHEKLLEKLK